MEGFKYLGRILTATDDEWPVVVENLSKSRKKLAQLSQILGYEGADTWMLGIILKEVGHDVMIFGS